LNSFRKQLREVINLALNHNQPAERWISSNVKRLYIVVYRCASANNVNIYICLRRRVPICKLTVVNKKKKRNICAPDSSPVVFMSRDAFGPGARGVNHLLSLLALSCARLARHEDDLGRVSLCTIEYKDTRRLNYNESMIKKIKVVKRIERLNRS